ncbi:MULTISPECIES: segregation/condensation protein A [unclassified Streptococcus]|uniref:segregation/condensation protein A n=1 Tax=unclassified Streptococcus TaxID=2608887 RepID=UPI001071AC28|nr:MULTISPECIES: segregation/condensation protein A [unclassified Streptococcus]MBF0805345.1 segregation/condensation protein A [Streptococcus sp. 19428wA2_WM07]TFU29186.1 segregation/condensation protein A [Streptococcus sp. WM07]
MEIKIKDFEGPLDLLLHLVSRYQMDIYDVPLLEVIEQYLAYLSTLQALRLEVASEYMVMASQLILLKSRKLLPQIQSQEEDELVEDMEQNLLQQLEDYRYFKAASQELAQQHENRSRYYSHPSSPLVSEVVELNQDVTSMDLFLTFSHLLRQEKKKRQGRQTTVERDDFRIEDSMEQVRQGLLQSQGKLAFSKLLAQAESLSQMITQFLACLELVKIQEIRLHQAETFDEIWIEGQVL